jgi:hypothetical protein
VKNVLNVAQPIDGMADLCADIRGEHDERWKKNVIQPCAATWYTIVSLAESRLLSSSGLAHTFEVKLKPGYLKKSQIKKYLGHQLADGLFAHASGHRVEIDFHAFGIFHFGPVRDRLAAVRWSKMRKQFRFLKSNTHTKPETKMQAHARLKRNVVDGGKAVGQSKQPLASELRTAGFKVLDHVCL